MSVGQKQLKDLLAKFGEEAFVAALAKLRFRSAQVILWRVELHGTNAVPMADIARVLGVSATRVRQIEHQAARQLRRILTSD